MPMPRPKSGESKKAFISRAHSELAGEFPDKAQRHAVVLRQWQKRTEGDIRKGTGTGNRLSIAGQLILGTKEEMEHTDNPIEAMKIAVDHLLEDQDYYNKLKAAGLVSKATVVDGFESPEPGDLTERLKRVLARVYAESRKKGYSKEKSAKIAWGAVDRLSKSVNDKDLPRGEREK